MSANLIRLRGRLLTGTAELADAVVTVEGDRFGPVISAGEWLAQHPGEPLLPVSGTLLPGLVDIHNHGGAGHEFSTASAESAQQAAAYHHAQGVTTVMASIVTGPPAQMVAQTRMLSGLVWAGVFAGVHAEGPFLSQARCGAQDPRYVREPDVQLVRQLLDAAAGTLRVMTLAPELPGYGAVADVLTKAGVVVALGHSDSSYATFAGELHPAGKATLVTHLANAMPPLHHRATGPAGAALTAAARGNIITELIADGIHTDAGFAALVFAVAAKSVALVSDATAAAGMTDGTYQLGAQHVVVTDGTARLASGAIAGSTRNLFDSVRWLVRGCGVPLVDAVRAATTTPAAAAGLLDVGGVRPGCLADLVVADEQLGVLRVMRRGQWLVP